MKQLILVLLCLLFFNKIIYTSFPVLDNNFVLIESFAFEDDKSDDTELTLIQAILLGFFSVSILVLGAYFLIRSWWSAWRDDIRWVKILTYILIVPLLLFIGIFSIIGYGYGN